MPHCQTLINDLRQKGYRITPQREIIIQTIAHTSRHISAEEIFAEVQTRTQAMNLATIYRTLDLLVEEGLVTATNLGEGKSVYASVDHGPHIHLVCRGCGYIADADPALLENVSDQLSAAYNFTPDLRHISIFGVCSECQKETL